MINHARTLFMNLDGDIGIFPEIPGDELIDPDFRALNLPTYMAKIRAVLCGAAPDRAMLNFRARQLLALVHSSRYADYLTKIDSRITYTNRSDPAFYLATTYQAQVTDKTANPNAVLYLSGIQAPPDSVGIMRAQWEVLVMDYAYVRVTQVATRQSWLTVYHITNNLSQLIPLGDSGLSFQFNGWEGNEWQVTTMARPTRSLVDLYVGLQSLGEPVLLSLFGTQDAEPWNTYRNLWQSAPETPNRLIGFLLAMLDRLEELRASHGG